jgi:non-ribosomal peptide synthetase component F
MMHQLQLTVARQRTRILRLSNHRIQFSTQLSYDHGVSSKKLIGDTIGRYLDRQVRKNPDGLALIVRHQNIRWTYQQFQSRINIITNKLLSLGVQPGDRVGIWSPNNSEWTLTQFATAKMGAILVNINPSYQQDELRYALNLVACKALVLAPSLKSTNYIHIIQTLCPELASSQPGLLSLFSLSFASLCFGLSFFFHPSASPPSFRLFEFTKHSFIETYH